MTTKEDVLANIEDVARAFARTFDPAQPAHVIVLEDLARFCRANESCVVPGEHDKTLVLEGRREVWLRIQEYLNLTPVQLFALKTGNLGAFRGVPNQ